MATGHMTGDRLAYVVVPIEGTVVRKINTWTKKAGLSNKFVEQPGGFLVYFPRGHVLRMKDKAELRHYRLHKEPRIINLAGLSDPNSPLGKLMMAQDDASRKGAMQDMQEQVMKLAQAHSGKIIVTQDESTLKGPEDDDED